MKRSCDIAMKKNTCIHFHGMVHTLCGAGVDLKLFNGNDPIGLTKAVPCIAGNCVDTCNKRRFPSPEEVARYNAEIRMRVGAFADALKLISEAAEKRETTDFAVVSGVISCPLCGNSLRYTYNYHTKKSYGRCKTRECLSWLM